MAKGAVNDPGGTHGAPPTSPPNPQVVHASSANPKIGLPPASAPTNHGKTSAAWVTTWVIVAGGVLCTFGAIFEITLLIVAGGIVIVVGMVIGRVMRAMGLGQGHPMAAPPPQSTSSSRG